MAKTFALNKENPAGSSDRRSGDDYIRALASAVAEILAVDHHIGTYDGAAGDTATGYATDDAGKHTKISFRGNIATPTLGGSDSGALYTKLENTYGQLTFEDSDDNEVIVCPVGIISPFAGVTAPNGWLLCDGSEVSQDTYKALYEVVGEDAYGTDAGGNFFLPDLQGRFPVGFKAADTDYDTVGETGGDSGVSLVEANIPAHTHANGAWQKLVRSTGSNTHPAGSDSNGSPEYDMYNAQPLQSFGASSVTPIETIPPYITFKFIIKT